MNDFPGLDVRDIQHLVQAVRLANSRGGFEMEEVVKLYPSLNRLEQWIGYVEKMQSEANQQQQSKEEDNPPKSGGKSNDKK